MDIDPAAMAAGGAVVGHLATRGAQAFSAWLASRDKGIGKLWERIDNLEGQLKHAEEKRETERREDADECNRRLAESKRDCMEMIDRVRSQVERVSRSISPPHGVSVVASVPASALVPAATLGSVEPS